VGAVDEVLGQGLERSGGFAEGFEGGEGIGDECGGVELGLLEAVDGGPGGFDGGGVFAGGLAELGGGLGDVEDVVDDLEGEAGFFAEDGELRNHAAGGAREALLQALFTAGLCQDMAEAEESAADDGGGDESAGLGAVDALDEFGGGLLAFAFDVHDLSADHARGQLAGKAGAGEGADAAAEGEGEFAEDLDDGGGRSGELREGLEGEVLERVAGENRDGFAEDDVAGGLAAAEVIVVESGEVVVDEGVGVRHLDGRAQLIGSGGDGSGDHAGGFHAEDGTEALAAGEGGVAHGAVDGVRFDGGGGEQALECCVGECYSGLQ